MNRTRTVIVATIASSTLALTACSGDSEGSSMVGAIVPTTSESVTVGSANFAENVLLAEIYSAALEAQGVTVERKLDVGAREELVPQLEAGEIDLVPEYSGALLSYLDSKAKASSSADVYRQLVQKVPTGLEVLDQSKAEDKDAWW